ncbi:11978_t:CDS:2 [Funneliformis geosporum]|nr:11978_t:CDS:2 [Funneliformis geosporum]
MRNACFVGGKAEKTMCKTCFVGRLLVETEKICSAYFVGEKGRNQSRKKHCFHSELDEELMLESEVSELEVANVVTPAKVGIQIDYDEVTPESPNKKIKVVLDANGNKCRTYYVNDGSTGNAINHLLNDHEITNEGKKIKSNQTTLPTIVKTQKHKESRQCELRQFLTDWIVNDLQPLFVVRNPSFCQLIGELDPAFVIPEEKGIKKIISNSYNSMLLALIEKINIEAKNSICALMLVEIIKTLRIESTNLSDDQDFNIDEQKDNVFENNEEQNPMLNYDINEPISTFGLLRKYDIEI